MVQYTSLWHSTNYITYIVQTKSYQTDSFSPSLCLSTFRTSFSRSHCRNWLCTDCRCPDVVKPEMHHTTRTWSLVPCPVKQRSLNAVEIHGAATETTLQIPADVMKFFDIPFDLIENKPRRCFSIGLIVVTACIAAAAHALFNCTR